MLQVLRTYSPARTVTIIGLAGLLAIASTFVSLANLVRAKSPEFALRLIPFDAEAHISAAERLFLKAPSKAQAREAQALAATAFNRDGTLAQSFRIMGMASAVLGQDGRASKMFAQSDRLSRRDLPARLWLIEDAVNRGDMNGALGHFDVALRTSSAASDLLFPILENAVDDPEVAKAALPLFRANPPWLGSFVSHVVGSEHDATALAALVAQLPETVKQVDEPLRMALVQKLATTGKPFEAFRLYAASTRRALNPDGRLHDTGFRRSGRWMPIDWTLAGESEIEATVPASVESGPSGTGLDYRADSGTGGDVAVKLLFLKPGNYRIRSSATRETDDAQSLAVWQLRCGDTQGKALAELPLPASAEAARTFQAIFAIPNDRCPAQWLALTLRASQGQDGLRGSVLGVSVDRVK